MIPKTYEMMCAADTIGLFQIESRAQMATLPRLKPECFYDLVVEVAIVMAGANPRRIDASLSGQASSRSKQSGVHIAHLSQGCGGGVEANIRTHSSAFHCFRNRCSRCPWIWPRSTAPKPEELRRALSFHRSHDRMNAACAKLRARMKEKGHSQEVTDLVVKSVQSFAVYGFPESHAISFALLAYASAWYKVHRAPEFYASLLNNQPMGFYSSATLIKDGQRRGLHFLPVSVCQSEWNCTVIDDETIRLGLCVVNGLRKEQREQIASAPGAACAPHSRPSPISTCARS